jgi:WS/DGAT/MGAT family acyltransferase
VTERLSAQDAGFLHIEDSGDAMHIGSVAVFEGPPPDFAEVGALLEAKLSMVPRYRQRVCAVPLHLGGPAWCDDPGFDLGNHFWHAVLPAPGDLPELHRLVGRVMSQPLDRTQPLWETWFVEGLSGGRWALISKVHHALVDGVGGSELLSAVLDDSPDARPAPPAPWHPAPEPTAVDLFFETVADTVTNPVSVATGLLRTAVRGPVGAARRSLATLRGLTTLPGLARAKERSSLNGPIGTQRRWSTSEFSLDDVRRIRKAHGGSVNDVVLAVATAGFRALLEGRGEWVQERTLRAMIPVSVRGKDEAGRTGNRVAAVFAELPVGIDDPLARLRAISAQLDRLKQSAQALAADALVALAGFAPPALLALAARPVFAFPQRYLNTVVTNVPGPQRPLFAVGRRMLAAYPFVPIASTVRVSVAAFSYDGNLYFAATSDARSAPDVQTLIDGIDRGAQELLALA